MIDRVRKLLPDPLVRLLIAAIVLATVLPVTGSARDVVSLIASAAIFLLFLLNGLRLPRREVAAGLANVRLLLPLVLWVFGAMVLVGLGFARLLDNSLPPMVALGFLFLGCLPSTVQSAAAYTSIARGNVAASVVGAAVTNVLGVFLTAPLFTALAGSGSAGVDGTAFLKVAGLLLLPFAIGQLVQGWAGQWVREHRSLATWMDRSSIAIAVYVAFSGAVTAGLWSLLSLHDWGILAASTALFLVFGFGGAGWLGRAAGLDQATRITLLFGGGQKSIAMGAPLATVLFAPQAAGMILVPPLAYHLAQLVISAPIAARLARKAG